MSRKGSYKKRILLPDPIYNSISVHMLVNRVLKNGKKSLAYKIVYSVLRKISDNTNQNPLETWEKALNNVKPRVEVKPRRRAGSIQQVPAPLNSRERAHAIAIRWILAACRKRSGKNTITKLVSEISEAAAKGGMAFRKKEELHKIALTNQMNSRNPEIIVQAIIGQPENQESNLKANRSFNLKKNISRKK